MAAHNSYITNKLLVLLKIAKYNNYNIYNIVINLI